MKQLFNGIERFQNDVFPIMEKEFSSLSRGQQPETLLITCSDSRIDPNLITQTKPGELFVIRNAGNIVPRAGAGELGVEATIQYAVDVLRVKYIVVCGHSHCGAIQGLLDPASLDSLPAVKEWVLQSEPLLDQLTHDSRDRLSDAVAKNVLLQLSNLATHDCVAQATSEGRLSLHGWVYHFENGQIDFVGQDSAGSTTASSPPDTSFMSQQQ